MQQASPSPHRNWTAPPVRNSWPTTWGCEVTMAHAQRGLSRMWSRACACAHILDAAHDAVPLAPSDEFQGTQPRWPNTRYACRRRSRNGCRRRAALSADLQCAGGERAGLGLLWTRSSPLQPGQWRTDRKKSITGRPCRVKRVLDALLGPVRLRRAGLQQDQRAAGSPFIGDLFEVEALQDARDLIRRMGRVWPRNRCASCAGDR